jgi:hypothetical protein
LDEKEWWSCKDPMKMLNYAPVYALTTDRKLRLFCAAAYAVCYGYRLTAHATWKEWERGEEERTKSVGSPMDNARGWCRSESSSASHFADLLRELLGNWYRCPLCSAHLFPESKNPCWERVLCGCNTTSPSWRTPQVLALAEAAFETSPLVPCPHCERSQMKYSCPVCDGPGTLLENGRLDPEQLLVLTDALEEAGCPTDVPCLKCTPNFKTKNGYGLGWVQGHDSAGYFNLGCDSCGGSGLLGHGGKEGTGRVANPLLTHLRSPGPHFRGCWALDMVLGKN